MGTLHRRRAAVVLVNALVMGVLTTVALVAVPASAQEANPSPAPSPSPAPAAVEVTEADSGSTVHLVPGQELLVELTAPSQGEQWQGPATVGPLYLVEYSEGASGTTARLQALHSTADPVVLGAKTDRRCFHDGSPCPQGFSEWSLSVVVDEGPPAEGRYDCPSRPMISPDPNTTYITESSGGPVQVEVGRTIFVWLHSCTGHYTVPAAGAGPLWREGAGSRANGYAVATFRGLRPGTTTITAHADPACAHTANPCAVPAVGWATEVQVVPAGTCERATVELERDTVVATGDATATVRAPAGTQVDLYAYTQPSTTYRLVRRAAAGEDGLARFTLRPPANTRLYAALPRCAPGPSTVLNVATALSLDVTRAGPRTYRFSGDSLPARSGGLIVSLYRLTDGGRQVLTAQTRADAGSGEWSLVRRFTGTGRFGFVVRTGQDLQNAPGASNVRSLLVF
jgi:hypothetical protein